MAATSGQFWTQQFLKDDGTPYAGVRVFHYVAGNTTTNLDVFQDAAMAAAHNNPVDGDASGRVFFYASGTYRLLVKSSTADGNLTLYDWDPVELVHHTATVRAEDKGLALPAATSAARGRLFGIVDAGGDVQSLWMEKSAAEWQRILMLPSLSSMIQFNKGTDVASSTNTAIPVDGNFFDITGTTTIESFTAYQAGTVLWTRFTGTGLTLTYNAASFILLGGANYVTTQNEIIMWLSLGAGNWAMLDSTLYDRQSASIASAATTNIWDLSGTSRHITGTNTITSLGTAPSIGAMKTILFDGILTLTHSANLNLPGGVNITTAAGDAMSVYADTTTQLDVLWYSRASGFPVIFPGLVFIESINLATTNILSNLGSTYDEHLFQLIDVIPGTNNNDLLLTLSIDNGLNFVAADYDWSIRGTNVSAASSIKLFAATSNTVAVGGVNGWVHLIKPQATGKHKQVRFVLSGVNQTICTDSSGSGRATSTAPINVVASAVNAVKIAFGSGTMTGTVRHYGLRNA